MRMLAFWAILALLAVASLVDDATACWRRGACLCEYSPCNPVATSATIVVLLPADAKVFFDDQPTTSTGPRRVFTTPNLQSGKEYAYSVKAEGARDGRPVSKTKKVTFVASSTSTVDF